jgi:predicted nucleic acid-binding protein
MSGWMLDTNAASHVIRGDKAQDLMIKTLARSYSEDGNYIC